MRHENTGGDCSHDTFEKKYEFKQQKHRLSECFSRIELYRRPSTRSRATTLTAATPMRTSTLRKRVTEIEAHASTVRQQNDKRSPLPFSFATSVQIFFTRRRGSGRVLVDELRRIKLGTVRDKRKQKHQVVATRPHTHTHTHTQYNTSLSVCLDNEPRIPGYPSSLSARCSVSKSTTMFSTFRYLLKRQARGKRFMQ
jgi:hypothetical protein